MKKFVLILLASTMLVLAGCLPKTTAAPTPSPTQTTATHPPTPELLTVPTESTFLPSSGCTVVTQKPTPGPTPKPTYPPVTETDWVKGPADAKVTIIEYSDFQ